MIPARLDTSLRRVMGVPDRPALPPIFVVGPPRSGTTVVAQHLLNSLECAYIPNIVDRWPRAPLLAARVATALARRPVSYENAYGETRGWLGLSDGWNLFHRWFPRYDLSEPIDPRVSDELPQVFAALEALFGGPVLNKNNHHCVRLRTLMRVFPDALVIRVSRDAADTTLSLVKARRRHRIPVREWWSCPAPAFLGEDFKTQVERSAATVVGVEAHLDDAMAQIPTGQRIEVTYATFCDAPDALIDQVRDAFGRAGHRVDLRADRPPARLRASTAERVPQDVQQALSACRRRLKALRSP